MSIKCERNPPNLFPHLYCQTNGNSKIDYKLLQILPNDRKFVKQYAPTQVFLYWTNMFGMTLHYTYWLGLFLADCQTTYNSLNNALLPGTQLLILPYTEKFLNWALQPRTIPDFHTYDRKVVRLYVPTQDSTQHICHVGEVVRIGVSTRGCIQLVLNDAKLYVLAD